MSATAPVVALGAQTAHAPAFRIRVALPARRLTARGVDIDLLPLFSPDQGRRFAAGGGHERAAVAFAAHRRLRRAVGRLDGDVPTVLIQRQADILPSLAIERTAAAERRLVLDIDDAIWHHGRVAGGHPLAVLKGSRRKTRWLAGRADVVVAGNERLAEFLSRHSRAVTVIPSLVDVGQVPVRRHADGEALVLGWIGSPSTVAFLEGLGPVLTKTATSIAPRLLELLVVGGRIDPVPAVRITCVEWSEAAELDALGRIDVGLMPLDDTPFTRGKCAYKALQYMAAGIPVVADDVGISARVIGDGAAGLIPSGRGDWVEALATLGADAGLRALLGAEGRRRVTADFSYERWLPELAGVLGGR